jgi:transposase
VADLFWLSNDQWERIKPFLPVYKRGFKRVDDRRVISGIIHVLKTGVPWRSMPKEYGPARMACTCFWHWAEKGIWEDMFATLADRDFPDCIAPRYDKLAKTYMAAICSVAILTGWRN